MLRPARTVLVWLLALTVLAPAAWTQTPAARTSTAASDEANRFRWPQAYSDIAPDPDVRFGTLPNGMRYAIRRNATPAGQASLRLRFDIGSLMESDAQQGLAHFLEHMSFNGSTNVPEGEMIQRLQRLGLAFGPDTNAFTSHDQTVYMLDLPNTRDETVDTGLMLLRETAGELTLSAAAVDRERGVVLAEERTGATAAFRAFVAQAQFQLQGQRYGNRMPIGRREVISSAPRDQLLALYHGYYRPERATLVMVGDFDPAVMETRIRQRFGDWRAVGPAGPEPDLGRVAQRRREARLFVEPGAPPSLQFAWLAPPDLTPDSRERRRRMIIEQVALLVLNQRLTTLARSAQPPWVSANVSRNNQARSARITAFEIEFRPGQWRDAVTAAEQEVRRATTHGILPAELERVITDQRTALQVQVAQAATQRTPDIASAIAGYVHLRAVYTNPQQNLAIFEDAVRGLTAQQATAALTQAFAGQGPLLFLSSPTPVEGAETAVLAAYDASVRTAVSPPTALAALTWPYAPAGQPGVVAERREVTDLGVTFVRFANGVRLTVRPSRLRQDQILIAVRFGHGRLGLSPSQPTTLWAGPAYIMGGLGRLSSDDLQRVLSGRTYGVTASADDDAFNLTGATRPADFDIQMQLLAAYLTDPGWRPEAFEQIRSSMISAQAQLAASHQGVIGRDLEGLLHNGDPRWLFPTSQQIAGASVADLRRVLDPSLSGGAVEVIIAGDVTVDEAIRQTSTTFGALPTRPAPSRPTPPARVRFPDATPRPVVLTHGGRPDQAVAFVAWPTTDFFANRRQSRSLTVLAAVMNLRLMDRLRETLGVTYAPGSGADASLDFDGYGYLYASVEAPPERTDAILTEIRQIATGLRDNPPTLDELNRARNPRVQDLERARSANEYWLSGLGGAQDDPRRLESLRTQLDEYRAITPADVQAAARTFLRDERMWRLIARPAAAAAAR